MKVEFKEIATGKRFPGKELLAENKEYWEVKSKYDRSRCFVSKERFQLMTKLSKVTLPRITGFGDNEPASKPKVSKVKIVKVAKVKVLIYDKANKLLTEKGVTNDIAGTTFAREFLKAKMKWEKRDGVYVGGVCDKGRVEIIKI